METDCMSLKLHVSMHEPCVVASFVLFLHLWGWVVEIKRFPIIVIILSFKLRMT